MPALDLIEDRDVSTDNGRGQERLETVGDSGHRGVHHHRPKVRRHAVAKHGRDVAPIRNGRDAGPPEFKDDPAFAIFKHGHERAWGNRRWRPEQPASKLPHSSSKISRSSFSNCRSASTSSTRLHAALPRLPTAAAWGRRSARSINGSKSCDSSASPRNSSSMSKCSSSRSLIFREKPLKSIGSISPRHEAAHYIGFCPAFNWCEFLHPMRLYSIRGGNPVFQGYYFLIL